jgi:hypothetical protein
MYSKKSGIRRKAMRGGFFPGMMGMMGNPMEMLQKFNPMSMLMGKGVVNPQYQYSGGSVVNPQYQYRGGRVVNPQYQYRGGMDAATFFNPMTSPLSPISMFKNMFGMGQVGGKKKRAPSARGQKVAQLMRSQGMTLGQASKHLKSMGQ